MSSIVDRDDIDLLMTAALSILLRRDMGLNRRLWSWMLGPDTKEAPDGELSTFATKDNSSGIPPSQQVTYFVEGARPSLQRSILTMMSSKSDDPGQRGRAYLICLSLMDTWQIGGSLLPDIFLPALQHLYEYSLAAEPAAFSEVLTSASQFFDSVEAGLIWSTIVSILQDACKQSKKRSFSMVSWLLNQFNVQDQEMRQVHAPLAMTYLMEMLARPLDDSMAPGLLSLGLDVAEHLLAMVPDFLFHRAAQKTRDSSVVAKELSDIDVAQIIGDFYLDASSKTSRRRPPLDTRSLGMPGSVDPVQQSIELLVSLRAKLGDDLETAPVRLFSTLNEYLQPINAEGRTVPVRVLSSVTNLLASGGGVALASAPQLLHLVKPLATHLWSHLSPRRPKYHVEVVKCLWQVERAVAPSDAFEVALLELLGPACWNPEAIKLRTALDRETLERFMVLWNHTLLSKPSAAGTISSRRSSAMSVVIDSSQATHRVKLLTEPLFAILDSLADPGSETFETITLWLGSLPTLDSVLGCLLARYWSVRSDIGSTSIITRAEDERSRELTYVCGLLQSVFSSATPWTWQCLKSTESPNDQTPSDDGVVMLLRSLLDFLSSASTTDSKLRRRVLNIVDMILAKSDSTEIFHIDLEDLLLDFAIVCLRQNDSVSQGLLLSVITKAILGRLHQSRNVGAIEESRILSLRGRPSPAADKKVGNATNGNTHDSIVPPSRLLECLLLSFESVSARPRMEQWVSFISDVLPVFAGAIFTSLLPLVETICKQLQKVFSELLVLSSTQDNVDSSHPDNTLLCLLDALELILAKAHEQLDTGNLENEPSKPTDYSISLLTTTGSGAKLSSGLSSKTSQANSRLTVILAFHDAIRACFKIWTWTNCFSAGDDYDKSASTTTSYYALRLRNKTRYLLEQMFLVEPLESLEALLREWVSNEPAYLAGNIAAITLLQAMQSTRPKYVLPIIIDALCCRVSSGPSQGPRQSSLTIELLPAEIALFLHIYLRSIEDDAMDEVWNNCVSFLRDVLTNPLPYRNIMPILLSMAHVLAEKAHNTNFGEQRKMRKELADIFQKLLAATFSTLPGGSSSLGRSEQTRIHKPPGELDMALAPVLSRIVADLDVLVDNVDRATAVVNSISSNLLSPGIHGKNFPSSVGSDELELLLTIATSQPSAKAWKKDVADAVNDPRLFASSPASMSDLWFPILHQWTLRDRERMPELLARLTAPSSAGIMFGVGANAARLDADRKAQFNIRRVCLILLSAPSDTWATHLRDFDEKIEELFSATTSSSPSSAIKADLYLLYRALTLSIGPAQLSPLWPSINDNLRGGLLTATPSNHTTQALPNLGLLQACKLLDQLITISPDEFQLHEWLYITDTVDAVYQPLDQSPTALADQIVEALGTDSADGSQTVPRSSTRADGMSGRRPLLIDSVVDQEDVKVMRRNDFAKSIVRPFLSQLSIHAYESVYRSDVASMESCRQALLQDLLDTGTLVD
ncbi:hypothetical protein LTR86_006535 [Recurvomyces mirabilis]|nr:hypothetical protein LTR86_006535 [Recurvomyces mirabilis]